MAVRKPENTGQVLRRMLGRPGWEELDALTRLQAGWTAGLGPELAARLEPQAWSQGKVTLGVAHAGWMFEFSQRKPDLLRRLAEAFPDVRVDDLVFVVAPPPPPPAPGPPAFNPDEIVLSAQEEQRALDGMQGVTDPVLRSKLVRLRRLQMKREQWEAAQHG